MLKPALRRAWRAESSVQFGAARAHAVAVGPVNPATASFLQLLDGTRGLPLLRSEAVRLGLAPERVDDLVGRLIAAGLIDDATGGSPPVKRFQAKVSAVERLRPDHASLSLVHPEPLGAWERLAARRAKRVQVRGAGRVGAAIAALLAAAGVGQVDVLDGGCVAPWDTGPCGVSPGAVGERRDAAARRAVRRAGVGPVPGRLPSAALALVVIAPRDGLGAYAPDPLAAEQFMASGTPHVYAGVVEGTGVVGPLVLPGGSACAGCLAARRCAEEPEWPRLLAQWRSGGRSRAVPACDIALATMVAGLAAAHSLTFLDGQMPSVAGARLECALPGLAWETSRLDPHPRCGCGAAPEVRESAGQEAGGVHV